MAMVVFYHAFTILHRHKKDKIEDAGVELILMIARMRADEQRKLPKTAFLRLKDTKTGICFETDGCVREKIVVY